MVEWDAVNITTGVRFPHLEYREERMKLAITICDYCKTRIDGQQTVPFSINLKHEQSPDTWNADICISCASSILKKLRSSPSISIEAKKEPVYRSFNKSEIEPETPYMGGMGNH